MADKTLSSIVGGTEFITRFVSTVQTIAATSSGDILTLTPPSGQKVKLNGLVSIGTETGITITIAGSNVITSKTLASQNTGLNDHFCIRGNIISSGELSTAGDIVGGVDEELVIKKDSGSTALDIKYNYQFGE